MLIFALKDDASSFQVFYVDEATQVKREVTRDYDCRQLAVDENGRTLGGVFLFRDVTDEVKEEECPSSSG